MHVVVILPASSPQATEDGGGSRLYITSEAFVHLFCGWVTEAREKWKHRGRGWGEEVDIKRERRTGRE